MSLCCARWRPAPSGPGRRRCALAAVLLALSALLWLGVAPPGLARLPQGPRRPAGTNASVRLDPGPELEGGDDGEAMRTVWCASSQPQVLPRLPKEARFRAFLRHSHCRYFPLLRDHPDKCGGRVRLLLAVKSAPEHGERREAVRRTWGRELTGPGSGSASDAAAVRTVFLLGRGAAEEGPSGEALRQRLEQEDRAHGDLLRWDFSDTFYNLTLKAVNFLRWFQRRCPSVEFVFQGDDDVFVHPANLLEFLRSRQGDPRLSQLFVGDVIRRAWPIRNQHSKYYIPPELFNQPYPPYAGGGGILMAAPLVRRLLPVSEYLPLFPIDDVFLGMCLKRLGVVPQAHPGFRTFGIHRTRTNHMNWDPCFYRELLMVHQLGPPALINMWEAVHSKNLHCAKTASFL
ncbi:UDP-GlcNAc:betaGal beta-1,3-N-acetylglucosaminyltransferase 7-like [Vombatus ursinus]|uniref:Hexosyltransferase n=1 Tax=Vombatus ursinus TaxID=29139 RepID=A0A4X2M4G9_VOMUR|nr:UDP-GlcNAc:betaGal beta-1,3-N-acetylglucosaminyltransferase 7-like [Vombatus ursinus]XP_027699705.1 UDP-GlcNAc:betaGal beta-1,3-N-acetylglucosaminyltransferase 7-like [Vombatus ursinus]